MNFDFTLQRVLGLTSPFSKVLSGTFRISPGSVLGKQHKEPTRQFYAPLCILYEVSSSLGPWEYFGICKGIGSRKGNSGQSNVPIILLHYVACCAIVVDQSLVM